MIQLKIFPVVISKRVFIFSVIHITSTTQHAKCCHRTILPSRRHQCCDRCRSSSKDRASCSLDARPVRARSRGPFKKSKFCRPKNFKKTSKSFCGPKMFFLWNWTRELQVFYVQSLGNVLVNGIRENGTVDVACYREQCSRNCVKSVNLMF